jgi:alkylhydroperoxidase/carboxymuconolactone decarboxylase family protein YurZ
MGKLHFRATANTEVSREAMKAILMHSAIYASVPAAFGTFQVAAQIFDQMDKEAAAAKG